MASIATALRVCAKFGDTADCPSPLRFDATAPKPEAENSALQPSVRSGLNTHKFRAPTG